MNKTKSRIAIPLAEGQLCAFRTLRAFRAAGRGLDARAITTREDLTPPPHEPECCRAGWPSRASVWSWQAVWGNVRWRFRRNIRVVVGLAPDTPERLVEQYLEGTLKSGTNVCDH